MGRCRRDMLAASSSQHDPNSDITSSFIPLDAERMFSSSMALNRLASNRGVLHKSLYLLIIIRFIKTLSGVL
jgi:hypothetical protein